MVKKNEEVTAAPPVDVEALEARVSVLEAKQQENDRQLTYMTDKLKKSRLL